MSKKSQNYIGSQQHWEDSINDDYYYQKQMEKEQIMQAYNDGKAAVINIEKNMSLEEYLEKTFKNKTK